MRPLHDTPSMRARRQGLRRNATASERRLWHVLRRGGVAGARFRRQHSVGGYVLDFYCVALRLALELDGAVHDRPDVRAYDRQRTAWLQAQGVRVYRLRNEDVWQDAEAVRGWVARLVAQLAAPT